MRKRRGFNKNFRRAKVRQKINKEGYTHPVTKILDLISGWGYFLNDTELAWAYYQDPDVVRKYCPAYGDYWDKVYNAYQEVAQEIYEKETLTSEELDEIWYNHIKPIILKEQI